MPERVLIFANPISGRGRGRRIAGLLEKRLGEAGYAVQLILDRPEGLDPAAHGCDASVRCAIVIGGDGTLRAVAHRLHEHLLGPVTCDVRSPRAPTGDGFPPLLLVPMGTANLMGRHLGIRWTRATFADDIVATVRARRVVHLDAAGANGSLFLLMAGVGLDAQIVHELDRLRRGPITYASYALPAALALKDYRYPSLEVRLDGKVVYPSSPALAFVGNIKEYGTRFPILPHARPDDGLLDVCVLPCKDPFDLPRLALLALAGEHLDAEGVLYAKGRTVEISSPNPVPVQVDGEAAGHTPLRCELLPARLPFVLPV